MAEEPVNAGYMNQLQKMMGPGAGSNTSSQSSSTFGFFTVILVLIGLIAIYYLNRFLYVSSDTNVTTIVSGKRAADSPPDKLPIIPSVYEGGEFSVNIWMYISSFNKNRNTRKHIFELQGTYFSTLLICLGAFKNTLIVRTHTKEPGLEGFQSMSGPLVQRVASINGFQSGNSGSGPRTTVSAVPPNASDVVGSLTTNKVNSMFTQMAMDDTLLTTPAICDLPEIDLQRWTMVTVVLTGRTIDVYMDGKLSRSCMTPSFFKVDPTGVKPVINDRGGFDGYMGNTTVANYAMNPEEIYRNYLSGPDGGANFDFIGWFVSLFKGSA